MNYGHHQNYDGGHNHHDHLISFEICRRVTGPASAPISTIGSNMVKFTRWAEKRSKAPPKKPAIHVHIGGEASPPLSHSPTHNKRCIRYPIFQNHQFPFRSISALNSLTFSMSSVLRAKAKFMKKLSQVDHYFLQFIHPENLLLIFSRRRQRVQRSVERRVASSGPRLPRPPSQNSTLLDSTFLSWLNCP